MRKQLAWLINADLSTVTKASLLSLQPGVWLVSMATPPATSVAQGTPLTGCGYRITPGFTHGL